MSEDLVKKIAKRNREEVLERRFGHAKLISELTQGLEWILREELNSASKTERAVQDLEKQLTQKFEDIYFENGNYYIGEKDSPAHGSQNTKRGRVLHYMLEHEGDVIPISTIAQISGWRGASVQGSMYQLMNEVNLCSLHFYIKSVKAKGSISQKERRRERTIGYRLTRKNIIADPKAKHPKFEPIKTFGDMHFSRERFYIGSTNAGVYGGANSVAGTILKKLLQNIGRNISGPEIHDMTGLSVSEFMYGLMRRVNEYSQHYRISYSGTGYYRMEQISRSK